MAQSRLLAKSATAARHSLSTQLPPAAHRTRFFATAASPSPSPVSPARNHKVVVVGGGAAGLTISHQLLRTGKFSQDDIAVVDPAEYHHYQPGWTLVGGGLKNKEELRRPLPSLLDPKLKLYRTALTAFAPADNTVTLGDNTRLTYDHLVVAPGIEVDLASIKGLPEATANPDAPVSCIYTYDTVDKVFPTIQRLTSGRALFTQPAGIVKCAGAPQKIMWLALDHWKRAGLYRAFDPNSPVKVTFATALPGMFGVPKYSAALEALRQERGVEGLFGHDLIEVDGNTAVFKGPQGEVRRGFELLHVVPKMGPYGFVKTSELANEAGFVDVDETTLRHKKFGNVWSAGDASSLPTSKTTAAITAQSPVLVKNMVKVMEGGELEGSYDGYTSCPLLTQYGKVMLAEFKYGGVPKETFAMLGLDQATPRRAFYYMKKDFFPWVYYKYMVKGTWGGPKGWIN
ncbi:Sulfide:quinone oxidoreductase [Trichocladium antarcticum]|uniref:Sulfide:quinone oxidoreductase n=1 Tax=Trichocladium antarcticum TaxID=1450529 RepID=A0AAN6UN45_9PEZI|nr:Sulfide:quinone oxidoreductase [Trichocladium antarcticum]